MNESKLIYAAGFIDDDLVCEALDYKPSARVFAVVRWACAAAAAIIVMAGFVVYMSKVDRDAAISVPPEPTSGNTVVDSTVSIISPTETSSSSTSEPVEPIAPVDPDEPSAEQLSGMTNYDDVFKGFAPDVLENPATYGPPLTYDEVMQSLEPRPDYPEYEVDSFYLVEVIRAMTNAEYRQMAGWEKERHEAGCDETIYYVKLAEDLISGEKTDRTAYVQIPLGSGVCIQTRQDPAYAPGDKFVAVLTKPCEGYDFVQSVGDYAFRYDLVEEDDGTQMLYYRGKGFARIPLDFPFAETIEITQITTTTQNPVTYTQRVELDALVEFMREDWTERRAAAKSKAALPDE